MNYIHIKILMNKAIRNKKGSVADLDTGRIATASSLQQLKESYFPLTAMIQFMGVLKFSPVSRFAGNS